MGYERNRVFLLVFEEEEFEGLEVRAKAGTTRQILLIQEVLDRSDSTSSDVDLLIRMFAGCPEGCTLPHAEQGGNHYPGKLISWNLEEDGIPVPTGYDSLMEQDLAFSQALLHSWIDAQVGTPGELGKGSNSGGLSEEGSIPMEMLLPVPPN